jgi:hypothetical protein
MRCLIAVLFVLASGCSFGNLGRQPGDPCDPESHGTDSLPIADDAACPDRATAARLLSATNSSDHLVSVDSDGTRVHQPARLTCCYAIVGGYGDSSCYSLLGADAGALVCDDAATAARQDGVLNLEGPDAAVASGPVAYADPAQEVCCYSVTTYTELSCSSNLPLSLAPDRPSRR